MDVLVVSVLCDGAELLSLGAVKRNYETEATVRVARLLAVLQCGKIGSLASVTVFLCRQTEVTTTIYGMCRHNVQGHPRLFTTGTLIFHLHCIDKMTKSHGWTTDLTRDVPKFVVPLRSRISQKCKRSQLITAHFCNDGEH